MGEGDGEGEGVGPWEETSTQRILCRQVRYVSVLEVRVTVQRAERGSGVLGVGVLQAGRSQGGYAGPTWRGGRRLRPGYSEPEYLGVLPRTVFLIATGPGHSPFVRRYAQPLSMAYLLPVLPRLLLILPCHRHRRTHGAREVAASVSGDLGALSHPPVLPSAQRSLAGIRRVGIARAPVRQVGRAALTWLLSREETRARMTGPIAHSPRPVVTAMRDDLLRWALGTVPSTFPVCLVDL